MKNSQRRPTNKRASAKNFKHNVARTHIKNVRPAPQRGGYRL